MGWVPALLCCSWSISPAQPGTHSLVWPWCCVLPGSHAALNLSLLDLTPLPHSPRVFPCFPKIQQHLAWGEGETPCLGFRRDLQKDEGGKHLEAVTVGCGIQRDAGFIFLNDIFFSFCSLSFTAPGCCSRYTAIAAQLDGSHATAR